MVEGTSAITASDVLGEVTETLRQKGEGALADKLHGVTLAFARVVVSTGTAFAGTRTQVILKYRSGATTSIVEHADARVRFYPNPTNGPLWISAPAAFRVSRAHIADAQGRTVGTVNINADGAVQLPGALEPGTYFVIVDGFRAGQDGPGELTIELTAL